MRQIDVDLDDYVPDLSHRAAGNASSDLWAGTMGPDKAPQALRRGGNRFARRAHSGDDWTRRGDRGFLFRVDAVAKPACHGRDASTSEGSVSPNRGVAFGRAAGGRDVRR